MAEILCKADGCSQGRGAQCILWTEARALLAAQRLWQVTIPISLGYALASKYNHEHKISIVFFGDGATDEGVFYECVNMAVLYGLPIIFVCENNDFATHLPSIVGSQSSVSERVKGFLINTVTVDGNNAVSIYDSVKEPLEIVRPQILPAD
jgi:pyruvate dehydrogenase E1 component alpha subunit